MTKKLDPIDRFLAKLEEENKRTGVLEKMAPHDPKHYEPLEEFCLRRKEKSK